MTHVELLSSERFRSVAAILAKGVLRYQQRIKRTETHIVADHPESASNCLEVLGETRLTVPRCIRG
jgi:hypothetical protein